MAVILKVRMARYLALCCFLAFCTPQVLCQTYASGSENSITAISVSRLNTTEETVTTVPQNVTVKFTNLTESSDESFNVTEATPEINSTMFSESQEQYTVVSGGNDTFNGSLADHDVSTESSLNVSTAADEVSNATVTKKVTMENPYTTPGPTEETSTVEDYDYELFTTPPPDFGGDSGSGDYEDETTESPSETKAPFTTLPEGDWGFGVSTVGDLCRDIVCVFGAKCVRNKCVCPSPEDCSVHPEKPVCMNGTTFKTECHASVESCLRKKTLVINFSGSCEEAVTPIIDVSEVQDGGSGLGTVTIVIIVVAIVVAIAVVVVIVLLVHRCRRKRKIKASKALINKDKPRLAVEAKEKPRLSSSNSEKFRASPKVGPHYMVTTDEEPPEKDRFSLNGCITPLIENEMANPFESFKSEPKEVSVLKREDPPQRHLSTENSVIELKCEPDPESGIVVGDLDNPEVVISIDQPENVEFVQPATVTKRENPPKRRHTSTTENSVYEVHPDGSPTYELEIFDDAFVDDCHVVTKL